MLEWYRFSPEILLLLLGRGHPIHVAPPASYTKVMPRTYPGGEVNGHKGCNAELKKGCLGKDNLKGSFGLGSTNFLFEFIIMLPFTISGHLPLGYALY